MICTQHPHQQQYDKITKTKYTKNQPKKYNT